MSKMTVANEEQDFHVYDKLKFVEFLEMIARIAVEKYRNT